MKHNLLIKLILSLSALVLLSCGLFAYRAYKPDPIAIEQIYSNKLVNITESADYFVITPSIANPDKPTIIFYSGGLVATASYLYNFGVLSAKLNSKIVLIKPPLNLAIIPSISIETIKSQLSLNEIILSGHSLGGVKACLEYKPNLKIKKIIMLGSYCINDISKSDVEYVSLVGSNDTVIQTKNLEEARKLTPSKSIFKTIEGGNHAIFGSYGNQAGDGASLITKTELLDLVAMYF
jgi:hypothetical protein